MVHRLFDPGSFLKLWSSLGHYWTWVFDIINSSLFSRVPPNSITFHIDFVFILMYVSIISQKFFTPIIEKFFYPTLKSFLPPRRPFSFDLSTFLSWDKSHISSGSVNKNGGWRWGKKLFRGVKN